MGNFEATPAILRAVTSFDYETEVKDLVFGYTAQGARGFVFTSRGSRVDRSLSSIGSLHFYLMTPTVSYYKSGQTENEVLISSENPSIMLDAIGKAVKASAGSKAMLVFDSISDLILSLGFPESYKFLKSALELLSNTRFVSLFILISNAQEKSFESAILERFPVILRNDSVGLHIVKSPEGTVTSSSAGHVLPHD